MADARRRPDGPTREDRLAGRAVAPTAPASGQGLTWNATTVAWEPGSPTAAAHTHTHVSTTGQTVNDHHTEDHAHSGSPTQQLTQANTHQSPDTDSGTSSLHHTIGISATQSAAGDHTHGAGVSFATPTLALGTAAAAGAAATVIRSDATVVAFDTTAPVAQSFGDAAATGSAAVAARRDHSHGMPATPAATPVLANGGNLASASTLTVAAGTRYHVTGTTTITALSTVASGALVALTFDSAALTITHNDTTLILAGGKNYVTLAGDTLFFVSEGSGNWREVLRPFAFGGVPFDNTSTGSAGQVVQKGSDGYARWATVIASAIASVAAITGAAADISHQASITGITGSVAAI